MPEPRHRNWQPQPECTLGDVQTVEFYNNVSAPVNTLLGKGGGGGSDASVPIQTGQLTLTVSVNMSYAIK